MPKKQTTKKSAKKPATRAAVKKSQPRTLSWRVRHSWHIIRDYLNTHTKIRWTTYVFMSIFALLGFTMLVFRPVDHQIKQAGVSFSIKYAEELGLDWQEAFTATVEDLDINYLRLMSYWDDHEPERDQYNFDNLDWQFEEAQKNGAQISLAVGLRQPRWPECHAPNWANELEKVDYSAYESELIAYTTQVAERYKDHPALRSYQLENEALNHWFGECELHDRKLIRDRAEKQLNAIRATDPEHPVVMSLSDQHGFPVDRPDPDQYGYSVYRVVYNDQIVEGYFIYPTPIWYHRMRSAVIGVTKNKPIIIHELQMEPWGPRATVDLSIEEQEKSMSVAQMYNNIDFARQIGLDEVYTWGAEWWYWRKTTLNDDRPWEAARDIFKTINSGQKQSKFGELGKL